MPQENHAELDHVAAALPLDIHADLSLAGTGLGLADAELNPAEVRDLYYAPVDLCLAIHSVPDILGKVVDYEKKPDGGPLEDGVLT